MSVPAAVPAPPPRLRRWFDDPGLRSLLPGMMRHLGPTGAGESVGSRPYQSGDDPRTIDWPLWARSGEMFVRRSKQEMDLDLELLLDASIGMTVGVPVSAWERAGTFCRWLAGTVAGARLRLHVSLAGPQLRSVRRGMRGARIADEVRRLLAETSPAGVADLPRSLLAAATAWRRRRMFVVVTNELPEARALVAAVGRVLAQGHAARLVLVEGNQLVDHPQVLRGRVRLASGLTIDLRSVHQRWRYLEARRAERASFTNSIRVLPSPAFACVEVGLDVWLPTEA